MPDDSLSHEPASGFLIKINFASVMAQNVANMIFLAYFCKNIYHILEIMKKFYLFTTAILMASAAGAHVSALSPVALAPDFITTADIASVEASDTALPLRSPAAVAEDDNDDYAIHLGASYYGSLYSIASQNGSPRGWIKSGRAVFLEDASLNISIEGFYNGILLSGGVYDVAAATLTFPQQQVSVTTSAGTNEILIGIGQLTSTGGISMTDDDIVFSVTDKEISYKGTINGSRWDKIIVLQNMATGGYYDYIPMYDFNYTNGITTFDYFESTSATAPISGTEPIYGELNGNTLTVTGLYGLGYSFPVDFVLDSDELTATATDAVVSKAQASQTEVVDYIMYDLIIDGETVSVGDPVVVFNAVETVDDNLAPITILSNAHCAILAAYGGSTYTPFGTGIFNNTMIRVPGHILAESGVGDVAIDGDDASAPVEYYDLRGCRVCNPTHGIYLRRQGASVSKILVR